MCLIFEAGAEGALSSGPRRFTAGVSTCFTFLSVSSDEELTVWGVQGASLQGYIIAADTKDVIYE